jgi:hypothetical protein
MFVLECKDTWLLVLSALYVFTGVTAVLNKAFLIVMETTNKLTSTALVIAFLGRTRPSVATFPLP